ncbi:MAG: type IV pilus twitching motility protein PilT [Candidatus Anammoxibacter sp.]
MDITELLQFSAKESASDVHISSGEPPIMRIHGEMRMVEMPPLSAEEVHTFLYEILSDKQRKIFEETHEIDFSIDLKNIARFRVNAFVQNRGESVVFRNIPTKIPTFEELKLPPIIADICRKPKGLVLVTGPTGSGKSTTLAAMIDLINDERKEHILTVEDPIEFVHKTKNCLISQRELGTHTHSFANALKAALREDPDVILVGEMRDLETISLAITAAETGHLVMGTLHTSSAAKTIDRIIDVFPPAQQAQIRTMFSESINAVIAQILLKKKGGGRVAAHEIMMGTPAIRNLIREGKTAQIPSSIQTGRNYGMQSMDSTLVKLYKDGIVEKKEILKHLSNPNMLEE